MAKDKKTIYIMLPVVLLVWAFVFYQLYGYFFSEPHYLVNETSIKVAYDKIKEDSFTIVADYRDPFLGGRAAAESNNSEGSSNINTKPKSNAATNHDNNLWPIINYKGMIKNNNSNKRIGIIVINGSEHVVNQGSVINEIVVENIEKNQIKVRYQKEHKIISK